MIYLVPKPSSQNDSEVTISKKSMRDGHSLGMIYHKVAKYMNALKTNKISYFIN